MPGYPFLVLSGARGEEMIQQCLARAGHQGSPFLCLTVQCFEGRFILRHILVRERRLMREVGTSPAPTASYGYQNRTNAV